MGYSRKSSHYSKIITLSNTIHMMSMVDPITIDVETLRIDSGCSLEKDFIELVCINIRIILYLTIN